MRVATFCTHTHTNTHTAPPPEASNITVMKETSTRIVFSLSRDQMEGRGDEGYNDERADEGSHDNDNHNDDEEEDDGEVRVFAFKYWSVTYVSTKSGSKKVTEKFKGGWSRGLSESTLWKICYKFEYIFLKNLYI